ncbi:MAG: DUF4440 domain-containing protein [Phascolarctobacterium sp.]|uniref:cyclophilin-like fold protein n=1 Tax=Phascolarctobacterium sp. TaxID=2049039 RepID=UPI0025E768DB|nr:cyclophilin-like fold protein [Phascolarctobacterium sp.]MCC8157790.1 DUF4440 domain-containing protein [Phascolarctobacterium sp.]
MGLRRWIAVCILVLVLFLNAGCSQGDGQVTQTTSVEHDGGTAGKVTAITMKAGDVLLEAALEDSETTREFLELLPRTFKMQRYNDREYYARLPQLSENGKAIANFENGDITYYKKGPSLAIFFAKAETESLDNLIRIGKLTSDLSLFKDLGDNVEMMIEKKPATKISQAEQDREVLSEQYHAMYQYQIAKKVDELAKMMTDDFILVHMTGRRQPKTEYLQYIKEGQLNYYDEKTDHLDIKITGNTAVMTGQSQVTAAVFGGNRNTWRLQMVLNLQKVNGQWLQKSAVASTY